MRAEPMRDGNMSSEVRFTGFSVIQRSCATCCVHLEQAM
jgi:hypothetical protein